MFITWSKNAYLAKPFYNCLVTVCLAPRVACDEDICIDGSNVCDGIIDCPATLADETDCKGIKTLQ